MSDDLQAEHRCYRAIALRHLPVGALAGLPVPPFAWAASQAATDWLHHRLTAGDVLRHLSTALTHPDLALSVLSAALVAAGMTGQALLDHYVAHLYEVAAQSLPAAQDESGANDQPGQAVHDQ